MRARELCKTSVRTVWALAAAGIVGAALAACAVEADSSRRPAGATDAVRFPGAGDARLDNAYLVAPGVISGGQPEGEAGFDALAALGVRTIISVDGARPDVEAAEARGMRYAHLPIGYDGVPAERRLEIARALRDLPGPVYLHCHHGKHRGPAAAASGLATLGVLSPEEGEAFLRVAGTSESYPGLFASVRESVPAAQEAIDGAPEEFPSVARVGDFVAAMAAMDRAFDHLESLAATGWRAPASHPDLVASAEAAMVTEALRAALEDPRPAAAREDAARRLEASISIAARLERMLLEGREGSAQGALRELDASCTACHRRYRNRR